jgi:hypothetical protein
MTSPSWVLQQAVYAALSADSTVTSLCGGRVFDAVPERAAFPYIVIGEAEEAGAAPVEHRLTLHLWSRGGGCREIKLIANAVRTRLDGAALTLAGHVLIDLAFLTADYHRQSDGETYRGTLNFRAVTEPV